MSKAALEDVRKAFGDRYAKAALDFAATTNYGFLTTVQNKYRTAGMEAYRAYYPEKTGDQVKAFGKTLPQATTDKNDWINDWYAKGTGWVGEQVGGG
jgi:hypothetical protein